MLRQSERLLQKIFLVSFISLVFELGLSGVAGITNGFLNVKNRVHQHIMLKFRAAEPS